MRIYIGEGKWAHPCIYVFIHTYTYPPLYTNRCMHVHAHLCINVYIYIYIYAYLYV